MNEFKLFGRVGRDPEMRKMPSGGSVANFSLATDNGKDKQGEKREPTWHRLTAFDKTADLVEKYVKVGDLLLVEGYISVRQYEKDGKKQSQVNLNVRHIEFGGGNSKPGDQPTAPARRGGGPAPVDDDDIPY